MNVRLSRTIRCAATAARGRSCDVNALKSGLMLLVCLLPGLGSVSALAATAAGEVINLSGTLSVQRPDGAIMVLGQKSEVQPGDLLTTQKDSYAQINFSDGSSATMRPNTQMKLEAYQFVKEKPDADSAFFRLLKGGMRTVTGLVGKRGNQDAYRIGTSTATIGIRGSMGDTFNCPCDGVVKGGENLEPGTHHQTHNGSYSMQVGDKTELINEGHTGFSNGRELKVVVGGIGGGAINLHVPGGGGPGLKGGSCK